MNILHSVLSSVHSIREERVVTAEVHAKAAALLAVSKYLASPSTQDLLLAVLGESAKAVGKVKLEPKAKVAEKIEPEVKAKEPEKTEPEVEPEASEKAKLETDAEALAKTEAFLNTKMAEKPLPQASLAPPTSVAAPAAPVVVPPVTSPPALVASPAPVEEAKPKKRGRPKGIGSKKKKKGAAEGAVAPPTPPPEVPAASLEITEALQTGVDAIGYDCLRPPRVTTGPDDTRDFFTDLVTCTRQFQNNQVCGSDKTIARVPKVTPDAKLSVSYRCMVCNNTGSVVMSPAESFEVTSGKEVDYPTFARERPDMVTPELKAFMEQEEAQKIHPPVPEVTGWPAEVENEAAAHTPTAEHQGIVDSIMAQSYSDVDLDAAKKELMGTLMEWDGDQLIAKWEDQTGEKHDGSPMTPGLREKMAAIVAEGLTPRVEG